MAYFNRIYGATSDRFGSGTFNAAYATAKEAVNATAATETNRPVGQWFDGAGYQVFQYFPVFNTSGVDASVTAATFSFEVGGTAFITGSDVFELRAVSSITNMVAGSAIAAQTPLFGSWTVITGFNTRRNITLDITSMARSTTCLMLFASQKQRLGTAPTGAEKPDIKSADNTGTTSDPYLEYNFPAWQFVGISNVVEVTATPHALVTTGIAGTLQAGDLLVACISSRIASTTSITLPTGGEWTLVAEQKNNNVLATTSAAASGLMAYCVRGASNPNLTFTHPVAPAPAIGRIVAYRNVNTASPLDTQTSFTTATNTLPVSGTGLTTTQIEDLIVAMAAGGQEAAWSAFNATDPIGASGATVTTVPTTTWSERADSLTTTGNDTSLAIFDAVKLTSGATGNLTATASLGAAHVIIAGAFKIAVSAPPPVTGTGTPAGQAGDADGAGVSGSAGAGTPAGQTAAISGTGTVGSAEATGTGALAASTAAVSGAGVSGSVATGTLPAQAATAAGAGTSASSGAGALVAQAATASGAGASGATGSGTLQAAAAAVAGAGVSVSIGTGSIVAGSAEIAGTGTAATGNIGALVAQAATVTGLGVSATIGSGALQAGASAIAGAGLVASVGVGALVAGSATVTGAGTVIEEGVTVGTGALVAGMATLSGEGAVAGEVAPPVSVGGGYWRPWRQPVAVEGVGYAILPQIEGEAHGHVVAVGAGAATLPRVAGTAVGSVGGVGRGAARLAIRATAVGERGQAGAGSGVITIKAAAVGRHDDDEAAMIALLLAA